MRRTRKHLEPMCDVQEMSVTTHNWLRRLQHYAHAHVFVLSFVLVLWILVFTLSMVSNVWTSSKKRRSYPSTAFHHANVTPTASFFSSGCCSPTVSCHRPLDLYPKFLHIFIAKTGLSEVLSLHFHRGGTCKHLPWYTESNLVVPFQHWHSSIFKTLPILPISILWFLSSKIRVLIIWSTCVFTMVSNIWSLGIERFWFVSCSYIANTELIIVLASHPNFQKILSFGPSPVDNRTSFHL